MPGGRPYFKYFIGGGIVCAEGGPFLAIGLMFASITRLAPGSNMLTTMAIVFSIIGAASLCIGLPLLYKGVQERNLWLRNHGRVTKRDSTYLDEEEPLERPIRQKSPTRDIQRRFCPVCGNPLPNLPNIKFCPKCGEDLI